MLFIKWDDMINKECNHQKRISSIYQGGEK